MHRPAGTWFQFRGLCAGGAATAALFLIVGCESGADVPTGPIPAPRLPEPPPAQSATKADDSSIIVGDRLQLFVMEDHSFNQELVVRERGDIILAPFGRIPVSGLSVEGAEKKIQGFLERDQLKKATVILDRVGRGRPEGGDKPDPIRDNSTKILVYMTEKVNRPGQHVITLPQGKPVGVYEAILITGGMDRMGDETKVYILRSDENNVKQKIPINVRAIRQGSMADPPIGHGDIVVVPERVFGF